MPQQTSSLTMFSSLSKKRWRPLPILQAKNAAKQEAMLCNIFPACHLSVSLISLCITSICKYAYNIYTNYLILAIPQRGFVSHSRFLENYDH
ncbi:hypothetical protein L2E82_36908 [Cichorium intybus]|uniref:Uncharacterized protein n=1 Tax=Cichorium intybus TaxID=13427 RepID=A0ACB9ACM5_CICIN|nr:hypothetical protein L2E82_36908 [Cichorium intybus]